MRTHRRRAAQTHHLRQPAARSCPAHLCQVPLNQRQQVAAVGQRQAAHGSQPLCLKRLAPARPAHARRERRTPHVGACWQLLLAHATRPPSSRPAWPHVAGRHCGRQCALQVVAPRPGGSPLPARRRPTCLCGCRGSAAAVRSCRCIPGWEREAGRAPPQVLLLPAGGVLQAAARWLAAVWPQRPPATAAAGRQDAGRWDAALAALGASAACCCCAAWPEAPPALAPPASPAPRHPLLGLAPPPQQRPPSGAAGLHRCAADQRGCQPWPCCCAHASMATAACLACKLPTAAPAVATAGTPGR